MERQNNIIHITRLPSSLKRGKHSSISNYYKHYYYYYYILLGKEDELLEPTVQPAGLALWPKMVQYVTKNTEEKKLVEG